LKVLLASGNRGKLQELRDIFRNTPIELFSCAESGIPLPHVEETGATYLENARLKAGALADISGLPALADDSGLEVDTLGGAPGIRSARFAGAGATDAKNTAKLLAEMADSPDRSARFRCVLVVAWPGGESCSSEGILPGRIAATARGTNGFGYDPVFVLPDGRHLAELAPGEKNAISHRSVAARNMVEVLVSAGKI